jgi:hypothetical protein
MNSRSELDRAEIERLAYQYWEERGCEHGCHDNDWYRAEAEIRKRRGEPMPVTRTVVGVFRNIEDAQNAFQELKREGFSENEIGFISHKSGAERPPERPAKRSAAKADDSEIAANVATDAGIGAALGGVGGLLLGFAALAVPGVGPVVAAGPIVAALGGAGVGAAAGGLIGALTEHGVPEEEARYYTEGVRRGDILVTVHAGGERADRAADILEKHHAHNIDDRVSAWRKRGWPGYDPNAAPLTDTELRREREYREASRQQAAEWSGRTARVYERTKY